MIHVKFKISGSQEVVLPFVGVASILVKHCNARGFGLEIDNIKCLE